MENVADRLTLVMADVLAMLSLIRGWLLLATPARYDLWAAGLIGALIALALGVPLVSRLVRIMLYAASMVSWLAAVPGQGGAMAGPFLLLVAVVLGIYAVFRLTFRFARTAFWLIAVAWCIAALWVMIGMTGR